MHAVAKFLTCTLPLAIGLAFNGQQAQAQHYHKMDAPNDTNTVSKEVFYGAWMGDTLAPMTDQIIVHDGKQLDPRFEKIRHHFAEQRLHTGSIGQAKTDSLLMTMTDTPDQIQEGDLVVYLNDYNDANKHLMAVARMEGDSITYPVEIEIEEKHLYQPELETQIKGFTRQDRRRGNYRFDVVYDRHYYILNQRLDYIR